MVPDVSAKSFVTFFGHDVQVDHFVDVYRVVVGVTGEEEGFTFEEDLEINARDGVERVVEDEFASVDVVGFADEDGSELEERANFFFGDVGDCRVFSNEGVHDHSGRDDLDLLSIENLLEDTSIVVGMTMRYDDIINKIIGNSLLLEI